jgi:hypothetical protein
LFVAVFAEVVEIVGHCASPVNELGRQLHKVCMTHCAPGIASLEREKFGSLTRY